MIQAANLDSRPVQDASTVLQVAQRITQEADRRKPAYSVEHVNFESRGDGLTGLLYRPRDGDSRVPGIVVTGSWTTVKEQMPAVYAERLAAAGYAALTFDFRGYGESEGGPRHFESPKKKVEDIRSAVDFLASSSLVDGGRVGLLGVCASAGYAAEEAASDVRVGAVALVAPWLHDAELVDAVYGGREVYGGKGVAALMTVGRRAAERYARNGILDTVPGASTTDPRAAMYWPDPEFLDYYLNPRRGGIPQWGNTYAVLSWPEWLGYSALASAPRLPSLRSWCIRSTARSPTASAGTRPRCRWRRSSSGWRGRSLTSMMIRTPSTRRWRRWQRISTGRSGKEAPTG